MRESVIVTLGEFQRLIERIYFSRDQQRGREATFRWFIEEVGELARAFRTGRPAELESEFADVLAWLVTLASLSGVEIEGAAVAKYSGGCPKCGGIPCRCRADAQA